MYLARRWRLTTRRPFSRSRETRGKGKAQAGAGAAPAAAMDRPNKDGAKPAHNGFDFGQFRHDY